MSCRDLVHLDTRGAAAAGGRRPSGRGSLAAHSRQINPISTTASSEGEGSCSDDRRDGASGDGAEGGGRGAGGGGGGSPGSRSWGPRRGWDLGAGLGHGGAGGRADGRRVVVVLDGVVVGGRRVAVEGPERGLRDGGEDGRLGVVGGRGGGGQGRDDRGGEEEEEQLPVRGHGTLPGRLISQRYGGG